MDLETYLELNNIKCSKMSRDTGINYNTLNAYVKRRRKPKLHFADIIAKYTNNAVTVYEMLSGRYYSDLSVNKIDKYSVDNNQKICL